jgi:hypothetical protein
VVLGVMSPIDQKAHSFELFFFVARAAKGIKDFTPYAKSLVSSSTK